MLMRNKGLKEKHEENEGKFIKETEIIGLLLVVGVLGGKNQSV